MARLVLTVVGDDRTRLVSTLAGVAAAHGANWEESQMTELAGKFAGVVVLGVAEAAVPQLTSALEAAVGEQLTISVQQVTDAGRPAGQTLSIHVLGNDRPGIVHEVSSVLARAGLGISTMTTECRDAPMAGGQLFEATIVGTVPTGFDSEPVRGGLERLASEIQVDIELTALDAGQPV